MKSILSLVLAAATIFTSTTANPQSDIILPPPCLNDLCLLNPPVCPPGEIAAGRPGCWCGCRPICRQVCPTAASTEVICLADEVANTTAAIAPCLGCCRPICGTICYPEPVLCLESEQAVGTDGCWSCCPIIVATD